jgi:uncharacterized membrane protein YeiH
MDAVIGPNNIYELPIWFDYIATLLWAMSGALFGAKRGFDITGIVFFSILACSGGGVIRDGLFLNGGPIALLTSPMYIVIPIVISVLVWFAGNRLAPLAADTTFNSLIDAVGTGGFALYGLQLAMAAKVSLPGALLVAVLNGVGGGLLRDVVANRLPQFVQPGVLYGIAALACCLVFLGLVGIAHVPATPAALIGMVVMVAVRMAALRFDLETKPVPWYDPNTSEAAS